MIRILCASMLALASTNLVICADSSAPNPLAAPIAAIRSVGPEGRGNEPAFAAWKTISQADAALIPDILRGMDGASPLSANWLGAAVDVMASRAVSKNQPLPVADLANHLLDTSRSPASRLLALELMARVDPAAAEALIPGFILDPAPPLRREGVARLIQQADQDLDNHRTNTAMVLYRQALNAARESDQIEVLSHKLKQIGQTTDLARLFGWLRDWKVVGPFDNTQRAGFQTVFPPETNPSIDSAYEGKTDKVRWIDLRSNDELGVVDFNLAFGKLKEVTAYGQAQLHAPTAQPAELRMACKNAWKLWLNGHYLFGRDEYHRGMEIDQYRLPVQLRQGTNTILIKLCQNEQVEEWTVEWQFQLRLCDPQGATLHFASALPR